VSQKINGFFYSAHRDSDQMSSFEKGDAKGFDEILTIDIKI
jgi:hypothetical protein